MRFSNPDARLEQVIEEFVKVGEAVAAQCILMPKGILVLPMAPQNPQSGAVYLYDREREEFHLLNFEGLEGVGDRLTLDDFDQLVSECDLLRYAERKRVRTIALEEPEWS